VAVALASLVALPLRAPAQEPAVLDSLLVRAERAISAGELGLGEELCREALEVSETAHRAQWGLATIALMRDDPDEAVKRAKKAVEGDETNIEYRMTLADAYGAKAMQGGLGSMLYAGRYKRALEDVLELDPKHIGAQLGLMYYCIYAPSVAGGGMDGARERADVIAGIDEYYGHLGHAVIAKREEDLVTAEIEYLAAAMVDEDNAEGWYLLGTFYLDTDRPDEAVGPFRRFLTLEPENLVGVYQLSKAHYEAGVDLAEAEEGFQRYIAADERPARPEVAAAHWRLGLVYEAQGRLDEAMYEYETALKHNPNYKAAEEAKDALEERRWGEANE